MFMALSYNDTHVSFNDKTGVIMSQHNLLLFDGHPNKSYAITCALYSKLSNLLSEWSVGQ